MGLFLYILDKNLNWYNLCSLKDIFHNQYFGKDQKILYYINKKDLSLLYLDPHKTNIIIHSSILCIYIDNFNNQNLFRYQNIFFHINKKVVKFFLDLCKLYKKYLHYTLDIYLNIFNNFFHLLYYSILLNKNSLVSW
jgi:hypothetical protein